MVQPHATSIDGKLRARQVWVKATAPVISAGPQRAGQSSLQPTASAVQKAAGCQPIALARLLTDCASLNRVASATEFTKYSWAGPDSSGLSVAGPSQKGM